MQRRSLGIYNWYIILDSILASNTFGGLLVNCKNSLSQVFFEVLVLFCFFFSYFSRRGSNTQSIWMASST